MPYDEPIWAYNLLGLAPGASVAEVHAAARAAIARVNADLAGDPARIWVVHRYGLACDRLLARLAAEQDGTLAPRPRSTTEGQARGPWPWGIDPPPPRSSWEPPPWGAWVEAPPDFVPPPVATWRPSPGAWGPSAVADAMFEMEAKVLRAMDEAARARIEFAHEIQHHRLGAGPPPPNAALFSMSGWPPDRTPSPTVEVARANARYAALRVGALLAQDRALWAGAALVRSIRGLSPTERACVQELVDDYLLGVTAYGWIAPEDASVLGDGIQLLEWPGSGSHSEGSVCLEYYILTGKRLPGPIGEYHICDLTPGTGLRPPCSTWLRRKVTRPRRPRSARARAGAATRR